MTTKMEIQKLNLAVFGDSNGHKGLVRRMDALEGKMAVIVKLGWVTVSMLFTTFSLLLYDILKRGL